MTTMLIQPTVDPDVQTRIVAYIARIENVSEAEAKGIFTKAVEWLGTAEPGERPPTPRIDTGWHAFILHTRDYAHFCNDNFGRFLHHVPDEGADCSVTNCYNDPR